ncbi:MAG TPA: glycoside hydrolase family 16 protein [Planctomycetota bacterium]|nr:glycoside hydrolase family 16 protein [Planctomycetota bacterium]
MTHLMALVALVSAALPAAGRAAEQAKDANLVWSDEFDGTTLDETKWIYRGLGPRKGGVNVKEAVTLDGQGHLVVTTTQVGDKYHTGMVATQGKHEWTYGYFECRVKFQRQPGHWSAFWLQSPTLGKVVGDLKQSGTEIDIFEYLARTPNQIQHNLHWDGYGKDHKHAGSTHTQTGLGSGWHTVGLEWTEKEYEFYVDGRRTWRTDKGVSGAPQYIILSVEVGPWAGKIAEAKLPDSVSFDYVRVYKTRPTQ